MPVVTVSSKHQVTLPAQIVRAMGLKPGSKLVIEHMDGRIVAIPEPESWASYVAGSARGVYGGTKEAIDRYVAEERAAWLLPSDTEAFLDYYVMHQGEEEQLVIDALANRPFPYVATVKELNELTGGNRIYPILNQDLVPRWVARTPAKGEDKYRLRIECAEAIRRRSV